MRISDWSSDVCSSDLQRIALQSRRIVLQRADAGRFGLAAPLLQVAQGIAGVVAAGFEHRRQARAVFDQGADARARIHPLLQLPACVGRSEEHTSELQSLMRISYAVFCLKKKKKNTTRSKYE